MPEDVANDFGRSAEFELATGMGVPEYVRSHEWSRHAGAPGCGMQNMANAHGTG
jgi:hypothetical protein